MGEVYGNVRTQTDLQRLLDGLQKTVAVVAMVGYVDATMCACDTRKLHYFVGGRPHAGRVGQPRRQAEGAIAHTFVDKRAHPLNLGRRCVSVVRSNNGKTDGALRQQVSGIRSYVLEAREEL